MPNDLANWRLASSDGWGLATWRARSVVELHESKYLLVELIVTCKRWNRVQLAQHSFASMQKTKEFSVILSQLLMGEAQLRELYVRLSEWLDEPTRKMTRTLLNFSVELCDGEQQSLRLDFSQRDEVGVSQDTMACTIAYQASHLNGETYFAVDQEGLRGFANGLGTLFGIRDHG